MNKIWDIVVNKSVATSTPEVDEPHNLEIQNNDKEAANAVPDDLSKPSDDDLRPTDDAQSGVKKIEAVTITWSKSSVYLILVLYERLLPHLASTSQRS